MAAQTLIQIGGQTVNASSVTLPASGRAFRDAWTLNGTVVEIDMNIAKTLRIEQLLREADEAAEAADKLARIERAKGNTAAADAAAATRDKFRGSPQAVSALLNAANPQALLAVSLNQMFP